MKVKLNKPLYAGFSIMDLAKTYIYDFHYNYIKQKFGNRAKLMYTDTDSLIYNFTVPDIYERMKEDLHKFDTSDYPLDNAYGMPLANKKVLGLMKDENNGKIMLEFVGLRAKLYAFRVMGDETDTKRAKGVRGSALRKITFNDYLDCALKRENLSSNQYLIMSRKHERIEYNIHSFNYPDRTRKVREIIRRRENSVDHHSDALIHKSVAVIQTISETLRDREVAVANQEREVTKRETLLLRAVIGEDLQEESAAEEAEEEVGARVDQGREVAAEGRVVHRSPENNYITVVAEGDENVEIKIRKRGNRIEYNIHSFNYPDRTRKVREIIRRRENSVDHHSDALIHKSVAVIQTISETLRDREVAVANQEREVTKRETLLLRAVIGEDLQEESVAETRKVREIIRRRENSVDHHSDALIHKSVAVIQTISETLRDREVAVANQEREVTKRETLLLRAVIGEDLQEESAAEEAEEEVGARVDQGREVAAEGRVVHRSPENNYITVVAEGDENVEIKIRKRGNRIEYNIHSFNYPDRTRKVREIIRRRENSVDHHSDALIHKSVAVIQTISETLRDREVAVANQEREVTKRETLLLRAVIGEDLQEESAAEEAEEEVGARVDQGREVAAEGRVVHRSPENNYITVVAEGDENVEIKIRKRGNRIEYNIHSFNYPDRTRKVRELIRRRENSVDHHSDALIHKSVAVIQTISETLRDREVAVANQEREVTKRETLLLRAVIGEDLQEESAAEEAEEEVGARVDQGREVAAEGRVVHRSPENNYIIVVAEGDENVEIKIRKRGNRIEYNIHSFNYPDRTRKVREIIRRRENSVDHHSDALIHKSVAVIQTISETLRDREVAVANQEREVTKRETLLLRAVIGEDLQEESAAEEAEEEVGARVDQGREVAAEGRVVHRSPENNYITVVAEGDENVEIKIRKRGNRIEYNIHSFNYPDRTRKVREIIRRRENSVDHHSDALIHKSVAVIQTISETLRDREVAVANQEREVTKRETLLLRAVIGEDLQEESAAEEAEEEVGARVDQGREVAAEGRVVHRSPENNYITVVAEGDENVEIKIRKRGNRIEYNIHSFNYPDRTRKVREIIRRRENSVDHHSDALIHKSVAVIQTISETLRDREVAVANQEREVTKRETLLLRAVIGEDLQEESAAEEAEEEVGARVDQGREVAAEGRVVHRSPENNYITVVAEGDENVEIKIRKRGNRIEYNIHSFNYPDRTRKVREIIRRRENSVDHHSDALIHKSVAVIQTISETLRDREVAVANQEREVTKRETLLLRAVIGEDLQEESVAETRKVREIIRRRENSVDHHSDALIHKSVAVIQTISETLRDREVAVANQEREVTKRETLLLRAVIGEDLQEESAAEEAEEEVGARVDQGREVAAEGRVVHRSPENNYITVVAEGDENVEIKIRKRGNRIEYNIHSFNYPDRTRKVREIIRRRENSVDHHSDALIHKSVAVIQTISETLRDREVAVANQEREVTKRETLLLRAVIGEDLQEESAAEEAEEEVGARVDQGREVAAEGRVVHRSPENNYITVVAEGDENVEIKIRKRGNRIEYNIHSFNYPDRTRKVREIIRRRENSVDHHSDALIHKSVAVIQTISETLRDREVAVANQEREVTKRETLLLRAVIGEDLQEESVAETRKVREIIRRRENSVDHHSDALIHKSVAVIQTISETLRDREVAVANQEREVTKRETLLLRAVIGEDLQEESAAEEAEEEVGARVDQGREVAAEGRVVHRSPENNYITVVAEGDENVEIKIRKRGNRIEYNIHSFNYPDRTRKVREIIRRRENSVDHHSDALIHKSVAVIQTISETLRDREVAVANQEREVTKRETLLLRAVIGEDLQEESAAEEAEEEVGARVDQGREVAAEGRVVHRSPENNYITVVAEGDENVEIKIRKRGNRIEYNIHSFNYPDRTRKVREIIRRRENSVDHHSDALIHKSVAVIQTISETLRDREVAVANQEREVTKRETLLLRAVIGEDLQEESAAEEAEEEVGARVDQGREVAAEGRVVHRSPENNYITVVAEGDENVEIKIRKRGNRIEYNIHSFNYPDRTRKVREIIRRRENSVDHHSDALIHKSVAVIQTISETLRDREVAVANQEREVTKRETLLLRAVIGEDLQEESVAETRKVREIIRRRENSVDHHSDALIHKSVAVIQTISETLRDREVAVANQEREVTKRETLLLRAVIGEDLQEESAAEEAEEEVGARVDQGREVAAEGRVVHRSPENNYITVVAEGDENVEIKIRKRGNRIEYNIHSFNYPDRTRKVREIIRRRENSVDHHSDALIHKSVAVIQTISETLRDREVAVANQEREVTKRETLLLRAVIGEDLQEESVAETRKVREIIRRRENSVDHHSDALIHKSVAVIQTISETLRDREVAVANQEREVTKRETLLLRAVIGEDLQEESAAEEAEEEVGARVDQGREVAAEGRVVHRSPENNYITVVAEGDENVEIKIRKRGNRIEYNIHSFNYPDRTRKVREIIRRRENSVDHHSDALIHKSVAVIQTISETLRDREVAVANQEREVTKRETLLLRAVIGEDLQEESAAEEAEEEVGARVDQGREVAAEGRVVHRSPENNYITVVAEGDENVEIKIRKRGNRIEYNIHSFNYPDRTRKVREIIRRRENSVDHHSDALIHKSVAVIQTISETLRDREVAVANQEREVTKRETLLLRAVIGEDLQEESVAETRKVREIIRRRENSVDHHSDALIHKSVAVIQTISETLRDREVAVANQEREVTKRETLLLRAVIGEDLQEESAAEEAEEEVGARVDQGREVAAEGRVVHRSPENNYITVVAEGDENVEIKIRKRGNRIEYNIHSFNYPDRTRKVREIIRRRENSVDHHSDALIHKSVAVIQTISETLRDREVAVANQEREVTKRETLLLRAVIGEDLQEESAAEEAEEEVGARVDQGREVAAEGRVVHRSPENNYITVVAEGDENVEIKIRKRGNRIEYNIHSFNYPDRTRKVREIIRRRENSVDHHSDALIHKSVAVIQTISETLRDREVAVANQEREVTKRETLLLRAVIGEDLQEESAAEEAEEEVGARVDQGREVAAEGRVVHRSPENNYITVVAEGDENVEIKIRKRGNRIEYNIHSFNYPDRTRKVREIIRRRENSVDHHSDALIHKSVAVIQTISETLRDREVAVANQEREVTKRETLLLRAVIGEDLQEESVAETRKVREIIRRRENSVDHHSDALIHKSVAVIQTISETLRDREVAVANQEREVTKRETLLLRAVIGEDLQEESAAEEAEEEVGARVDQGREVAAEGRVVHRSPENNYITVVAEGDENVEIKIRKRGNRIEYNIHSFNYPDRTRKVREIIRRRENSVDHHSDALIHKSVAVIQTISETLRDREVAVANQEREVTKRETLLLRAVIGEDLQEESVAETRKVREIIRRRENSVDHHSDALIHKSVAVIQTISETLRDREVAVANQEREVTKRETLLLRAVIGEDLQEESAAEEAEEEVGARVDQGREVAAEGRVVHRSPENNYITVVAEGDENVEIKIRKRGNRIEYNIHSFNYPDRTRKVREIIRRRENSVDHHSDALIHKSVAVIQTISETLRDREVAVANQEREVTKRETLLLRAVIGEDLQEESAAEEAEEEVGARVDQGREVAAEGRVVHRSPENNYITVVAEGDENVEIKIRKRGNVRKYGK
ncbi:uncharacterized protein [Neodiprion pinetum]|uniref:uncharacterized protein n=1 Tax=Neodiprion pinetum TaxID=441929 RepID=UPI003712909F